MVGLYGLRYPQESLENTINTIGYTVRGTPNCPLNQNCTMVGWSYTGDEILLISLGIRSAHRN